MSTTTMRGRGQLTIPADIRAAARLEEGDPVEVVLVEDGILLRPQKIIDATQAWFWTAVWQSAEAEADADIASGRTKMFDSGDAFLTSLVG